MSPDVDYKIALHRPRVGGSNDWQLTPPPQDRIFTRHHNLDDPDLRSHATKQSATDETHASSSVKRPLDFSLSRKFAGDASTYPLRPTGLLREILGRPGQSCPQIPKPE